MPYPNFNQQSQNEQKPEYNISTIHNKIVEQKYNNLNINSETLPIPVQIKAKPNNWLGVKQNIEHLQSNTNTNKINGSKFPDRCNMCSPLCNIYEVVQNELSEYTFYILSFFDFLYWISFSPWKIRYNDKDKAFQRCDAGTPRKAIVIVLHISVVFYHVISVITAFRNGNTNTMGLANKIMLVIFLAEPISFHYNLWFRSNKIIQLMTEIGWFFNMYSSNSNNNIMRAKSKSRFISQKFQIYTFSILLLCFYIFIGFVFTIVIAIIAADLTKFNLHDIIKGSSALALSTFNDLLLIDKSNVTQNNNNQSSFHFDQMNSSSTFYTYLTGILFAIMLLYKNFTWLITYAEILLWALMFQKVVKIYFDNIESKSVMENIRNFHTIIELIGNYNGIFGVNMLIGSLACAVVSALYVWDLLSTDSNESIIFRAAMILSILLFVLNLVLASEIAATAQTIISVLKLRLQFPNQYWQPEEKFHHEFIVGFFLITHELERNHVGFRGFHFFTISYNFLSTLMGIIMSYSIIILQFQLTADQASSNKPIVI